MGWRRIVRLVLFGLLGVFVLIQFVPYGRDHTNPGSSSATWTRGARR
jgi:hypothetical protein